MWGVWGAISGPPMSGGNARRLAEARVVRAVGQRGLGVGRDALGVVLGALDVVLPDLARQLVEDLDAVAVGIGDVHAVGHAVVDAQVERHAALLEERDLLQPALAIRVAD